MTGSPEGSGEEVARLQRCMNNLVSLLALPAAWSGRDPAQIAHTLLDALTGMLTLDCAYVRLTQPAVEVALEAARVTDAGIGPIRAEDLGATLARWLGPDPRQWPPLSRHPTPESHIVVVSHRLGLYGELGVIVAGSRRADFPTQAESLLLSVAANQAAIGLQQSRLLSEQRRVARELDQRVAHRTEELAAANEELSREVTERRRAEAALREEERQLKQSEARKAAILDSALDCIVTIDHQGCITEFNPAAERTFGYYREEVLGHQMADVIVPPSLRDQHQQGFSRYLKTGEARVLGKRLEMTAMRADGSEFPAELTITRIPLDGPPSFTGYLRDISDRKRSEEELRRSESFLAEAQRLSSTGIFSWRVATDEIAWSEQTYRIFELDSAAPVSLELLASRLHPEDAPAFEAMLGRQRLDAGDFEHEFRLLMPDRSVKYLHVVAHDTREADGQLKYIGWVRDVTERRLADSALSSAQAELARMSRVTTVGQLTAAIAHEVNQPLSGIITNASTCLRMLGADPPNIEGARETARRTIRDGNRAAEVIARLRALYTKKGVSAETVDLNEATREVIALTESELRRSGVIVREELDEDLPPVTADRVQLQQVVLNLVLNASDAMSAVEDRPRHLVIRSARDEANWVSLAVKDAGAGIDPDGVERLFEPFYTTKPSGMGIGLSVCRSIIENHRGRLWAIPNDGPGATFAFAIPMVPVAVPSSAGRPL